MVPPGAPVGICGTLLLLTCCLTTEGVCQNLTATIGDSVDLPGRPFKSFCEWEYNGEQKTNEKGNTIINEHLSADRQFIQRFQPYSNRTELLLNCTLVLKNIQPEDKGWYLLKLDLKKELHYYYYLNVIDPVCNVEIERTDLEDPDRVQLNCVVTGNATSLTWTRDGELVPETSSQPATLLVEIPSKYAKGNFECHVLCNKDLKQHASVTLEPFGVRAGEQGAGGHAMALTAQPLIAPPLAASEAE